MRLLSCFDCFGGHLAGISEAVQEGSRHSRPSTTVVIPGDWQTVPDDVLQAVVLYLTPSEAATARLTCRHWRLTLSSYTHALTLPTRFLSTKPARGALRRAGQVFPGAQQVTLFHANGWCDPVQARMDVEPLVRLESRLVSLEPLALGLPQLTRLAIHDATFTRDPWPLSQLLWLTGLKGLEVAWDTGLWAPGQVLQEAEALQPVFSMTQLTELILAKSAYLFLGEICLSDSALAAAAGLRNLAKLNLSTVRVQDEGFASLAMLPHLTHLTLRGQLNVTLGVLSQVFLATTKLEELSLGCVVPGNHDLKRLAAAHLGLKRTSANRQQQQQQRRRSVRRQLQQQRQLAQQLQLHENCNTAAATCTTGQQSTDSGGSGSSNSDKRSAPGHSSGQPGHAVSFVRGGDSRADVSTLSSSSSSICSSLSHSTNSSSSSTNSSSSSSSSNGVKFKGDDWSAVLLPLQRLRRLQLQSDLVLLGSCAALRSMASISHLELHGAAKFLSAGPFASLPPSWLSSLAQQHSATAAAAASSSRMGSSSSINHPGVADASSIVHQASVTAPGRHPSATQLVHAHGAWPALKSLQVDNLQLADEFVEAVRQLSSLRTLIVSGPCLLAQRQVHGSGVDNQQQRRQQQRQHMMSVQSPLVAGAEVRTRQQQQQQQQQQQRAVQPQLRNLSGRQAASEDFWSASAGCTAAASGTAGIEGPAPSATAAVPSLGLMQHSQLGVAAAAAAQLPADLDLLSRLSPLEELCCFQLHLQQHMPSGLVMTPFALMHLAAHWNHLTSISIDITAAAAATVTAGPSVQQHKSNAAAAAAEVGLLLSGLESLTSLKDLTLRLADDFAADSSVSSDASQPASGSAAAASCTATAAAAGQLMPGAWSSLPGSLESLSLHGFTLQGQDVRDIGAATRGLRHLRLLHCHISTQVLWCIAQSWPQLSTLVVKSVPMMGVGSSGVAAVAGLAHLRGLALSVEAMADVSCLAELTELRFLLLDGRSNTQLAGVKALRRLTGLRALLMPLLHLHHSNKSVLTALQLALPNTAISNISSSFGLHHGCQWFKSFSVREREWWREPDVPWHWYPALCIAP